MIRQPAARPPDPASPIALEAFADELLGLYDYEVPSRSSPTRAGMRQVLGEVCKLPGLKTTADLTPEAVAMLVRGLTGRGLARATIVGLVSDLRHICDHGLRKGYLRANPVEARRHWLHPDYEGRPREPDPDALSREEVTRLMVFLLDGSTTWENHRLYALAATVLYAGLRKREALELDVADCDVPNLTIRVNRAALGRWSRPMAPKLAEVLGDWLPRTGAQWAFPGVRLVGPWTGGPLGHKPLERLRAAGEAAGIDGLSFDRLGEFWIAAIPAGGVALGPDFLDRPAPRRAYEIPTRGKPGPKPRAPTATIPVARPAVLDLSRPDRRPVVRGELLPRPLARGTVNILKAMLLAGRGLTIRELAELSGLKDPLKALKRLRAEDPIWMTVVLFPDGNGKGGYRLAEADDPGVVPALSQLLDARRLFFSFISSDLRARRDSRRPGAD